VTLTVENCEKHLFHTLGGPLPPGLPVVEVINDTGQWLVASRPWKWLQRASTTMSLVDGQSYLTLPTDLQTILAIEMTNSLTNSMHLTSFDELMRLRTSSISTSFGYWGAVVYPTQTSPAAVPAGPRLDIYPTPSANETGAVTIFYRAGWTSVMAGSDQTRLNLPDWMEPTFKQALRAFGRGYEMEDDVSMSKRLADIVAGPIYQDAATRDGLVQLNYGEIQGGAAQGRYTQSYLRTTVQGPS